MPNYEAAGHDPEIIQIPKKPKIAHPNIAKKKINNSPNKPKIKNHISSLSNIVDSTEKNEKTEKISRTKKAIVKKHFKLSSSDFTDKSEILFDVKEGIKEKAEEEGKRLTEKEISKLALKELNEKLTDDEREEYIEARKIELDEIIVGKDGKPLIDKDGNEITKTNYDIIKEKNPILAKIDSEDSELGKDILAIYGKDASVYLELIEKNLKDGEELPTSIKEFDEMVIKKLMLGEDKSSKQINASKEGKNDLIENIKSDSGYMAKMARRAVNQGPLVQGKMREIDLSDLPKGTKGLLEFIAIAENSRVNYEAVFAKESSEQAFDKPLSEMTVREVIQKQREYKKAHGYKSAAIGAYQFMDYTLADMAKHGKINLNDKFTNDFQDKIATIKLKERGLDKYISGALSRDQFQVKLSQEWASLPKDESDRSYYAGDGLNHALVSNDKLDKVLEGLKDNK